VAEFKIEAYTLSVGDRILVTGPTTGAIETVVEELHTDDGPSFEAKKGQNVSFKLETPIRPSDKLYKIVPAPVPAH
jgi:putative protease